MTRVAEQVLEVQEAMECQVCEYSKTSSNSELRTGYPFSKKYFNRQGLDLENTASIAIIPCDDDVIYLFLQKQKLEAELHIYLEEGTYHKRLFRGPNTKDMKKWDGPSLSWPTPHTIPFFLPPEDPFPVLLRPMLLLQGRLRVEGGIHMSSMPLCGHEAN